MMNHNTFRDMIFINGDTIIRQLGSKVSKNKSFWYDFFGDTFDQGLIDAENLLIEKLEEDLNEISTKSIPQE